MSWARAVVVAVMSFHLLWLTPARAGSPDAHDLGIYIFGQNEWSNWEFDAKSFWDLPFNGPVVVSGKPLHSCNEVLDAMKGKPMTL